MPKNERERRGSVMRWFCGVPVLANPIILIDLFTAVVIIWFVSVLLVVGAQALLGAHIAAACVWATYVAAAMPLMYAVICLLFFRRGYVILYRLEENGLFMETMRGSSLSGGGVFAVRPFPVPDQSSPARSVTKDVSWADVKAVRELREMRAPQLRGRFGALATVYCPDRAVYEQALDLIRKKAALS